MKPDVQAIREYLSEHGLDAWLLYDFRGNNPVAAGFSPFRTFATRRWFVLFTKTGDAVALVHAIEEGSVDAPWAEIRTYAGRLSLQGEIKRLLSGLSAVAMEYSPMGGIPSVSIVDGGTLELVRSTGVDVRSSADLIQHFLSRWSARGLETHRHAARFLVDLVPEMFSLTADRVSSRERFTELDLQSEIRRRFEQASMVYEHGPIIASGPNSALPHYEPSVEHHAPIERGKLLLMDMYCRSAGEETVSADITWTAFVGPPPVPEEIRKVFAVVAEARDRAVDAIRAAIQARAVIRGMDVDDAARSCIEKAGYGRFFTHRTGHSLGTAIHAGGGNMDNFETRDERVIEPGLGFTIEPGIYLPGRFGIRSEINCYVGENGIEITTTPVQREVPALLD